MRTFAHSLLLGLLTLVAALTAVLPAGADSEPQADSPAGMGRMNILFLTMDDMNWDSVHCYGSTVEDISPHIDSLAERGMRFQHAFVTSPVCTPSRNAFQTGCYPHVSGVHGFYSVVFPRKTVAEHLKEAGYYTAIVQKVPDSTPSNNWPKYWDYQRQLPKPVYRTPSAYAEAFAEMADGAARAGKPLYANVNVIDPHLPFYRGPKTLKGEWDHTPPSRAYAADEVPIPAFLPQDRAFAQEVADYYSTVKRGDDCVGAVLGVLRDRGMVDNTIIIFISDHGMSMPFAKANLTPAGVFTPWIVVWPGVVEQGSRDTKHMVSAIDYLPTVLEMAGIPIPEGLEGRTMVPLLKGGTQTGRNRVFVEYNENPNADIRPMRGIYTEDYVYIFNPWSDGKREALMECRWYRSYGTFAGLAKDNEAVRQRFQFLKHRTVEEMYAYKTDPDAMHNLIGDPKYAEIIDALRTELADRMTRTGDYVLAAFKARKDPRTLEAFMAAEDKKALERSKGTEWKRWRNRSGPTGGHSTLYQPTR